MLQQNYYFCKLHKNFKMKKVILVISTLLFGLFIVNCTDNDDKPSASPINNFIWNGLNDYYLYQPQVPNLADSKNANISEFESYLKAFFT
ncbi:MAG: hypothetical protein HC787_07740 [Nostocaceae cyanobacterium CSU_2_110]|nr:hypothetical protein [Nostocaceae cyanobacterium CSU_2_110]